MATLEDIRRWDGPGLVWIAETVRARHRVVVDSGERFIGVLPVSGWSGAAAEQAAARHRTLTVWLEQAVGGVAVVTKALTQAGDAIPAMQRALGDAETLAGRYGFTVGSDGTVTDRYAGATVPPELHPADRARVQAQVVADLTEVLRTAADIDADLVSVFERARRGEFGNAAPTVAAAAADGQDPGLTLPEPPPNATAAQNAGWWATLSPAGRAILLHSHPEWVGNLDGLPATLRDEANRARLPGERARLLTELDAARAAGTDTTGLQADLASLEAVERTIARPDRHLLTLDTSGDRTKAAVAVGDVDTAEHVAVFTPGFSTTVDGALRDYDHQLDALKQHSQNISDRFGDRGRVAAVTWIGYEAPQVSELAGERSVAVDDAARAGAVSLDGFLDGIGAAHHASGVPLHLTALGHSYGSLTTGIALHQDTPVDDAVVFGSPGIGATQRSELHVPDGHLYSEWGHADPVPLLQGEGFGTSPYGALGWPNGIEDIQQVSTAADIDENGRPTGSSWGHSAYLDEHTTSQYNLSAIVGGRPDMVRRG